MSAPSDGLSGSLGDDHPLSARARAYGESVLAGTRWPLSAVDPAKLTWTTSRRAKRRHGRCAYAADGRATITLSEHTAERAGFEACRATVRHELVHAWQHQHRGDVGVATDRGVVVVDADGLVVDDLSVDADGVVADADGLVVDDLGVDVDGVVADADGLVVDGVVADARDVAAGDDPAVESTAERPSRERFTIRRGHGPSFRAWTDPLDLAGRCSTPYERTPSAFAYVYGCPACGEWWGKHRLCPSVRQAARGAHGNRHRYCADCDVLVQLRVGPWYLVHGEHDDATIRAFVDGAWTAALPRGPVDTATGAGQVVVEGLPVVHRSEAVGVDRPT